MWCDEPTYTEKVDVYSCALIFWEIMMWSKQYPFGDLKDFQIYEQGTYVRRNPFPTPLQIIHSCI